jgi:predicted nucleotidyltransferase component of viral defense system
VISRADIVGRVQEWGLAEHVVEKDYILGWVLWGIGADATLGQSWIFKGGTCLKKCYVETYRFSEDLDFTITPGGPLSPDEVLPLLRGVLQRVGEESGIDFTVSEPRLRIRPSGTAAEGRIYYRGPRNTPGATSVKLDLSADETVIQPTVLRTIAHPYPDALPATGTARCYAFEEVFAEKLRAMAQRGRPRDLYDIVNLFRREELRGHAALIREVLVAKCEAKGIPLPTAETLSSASHRDELESEWANMLGHQLPALPPLEQFVDELPALFAWLHGEADPAPLAAIPTEPGDRDDLGAERSARARALRGHKPPLHRPHLRRLNSAHTAVLAATHSCRRDHPPRTTLGHRRASRLPGRADATRAGDDRALPPGARN